MRLFCRKGFTLLEFVLVIMIMGIMAAICIPNYRIFMAQRRLNGAARQIMSDLMAARMQAITQDNEVRFYFPDNHRYYILDDDDGDGIADTGESLKIKDIQADYRDVTLCRNVNPIFRPRGTAALGGTITLTNSQGSKYVIFAPNGRLRISDTPPS